MAAAARRGRGEEEPAHGELLLLEIGDVDALGRAALLHEAALARDQPHLVAPRGQGQPLLVLQARGERALVLLGIERELGAPAEGRAHGLARGIEHTAQQLDVRAVASLRLL
ncbi:MAG TPA: hypothetical protein VFS78_19400, partial [Vicinamibacteria bacterium]|nr:hypothetical protein [Vicinamibacteria bacterium]